MPDFDITAITMPFGTLRRKIRKALLKHHVLGGEIECLCADGLWYVRQCPQWDDAVVYRAKPTEPIISNIVLSAEHRGVFVGVQARAQAETQPHPIFAAVKEWHEAVEMLKHNPLANMDRYHRAMVDLAAIKVPE